MNSCIPTPAKPVDKPFLMAVEDVFAAERRGVIVVGQIERGLVEVGESVEIVGMQNEKRIAPNYRDRDIPKNSEASSSWGVYRMCV